ncbi:PREDICTED: uncharacterized protein LOC108550068 [Eufriesea mexicana]|uniref:uncharacterized protein LOC108550068 n=1 Tax=Eufriesea mexicana TaxID=516756 RepID=UPI00083C27DF|nr:PREDICTED: uncharacterized protein LOC108550068 [Eufriesea mexicana]
MLKQMTPEKAVQFTKFSMILTFCWPPSIHSSRTKVLVFKVIQIMSIIHGFIQILAFLHTIYYHLGNILLVSKSFCLLLAATECIVQTLVCFVNHNSLQRIIEEIMICLEEANQSEREIFDKYTAKCSPFYGGSIVLIYGTATLFLLGPIFMPINFPLDIEYPFEIDYAPVNVIIYTHQALTVYHFGAHTALGIFGALLIWFSAARFECLATEFKECLNVHTMIVCIKKQLYIRR